MARRQIQTTQWPWRLFLFSALVLVTTIVLYLGLEFGYKSFLNSQIREKDQSITDLSQAISQEEQDQFVNFYSQLANLRILLDDHVYTSRIFPFLEQNTNRSVRYEFIDFNLSNRQLILEGVAASYDIFSQQLEAFSRAEQVERLLVNESQQDGSVVRFRVSLFLIPTLFESP